MAYTEAERVWLMDRVRRSTRLAAENKALERFERWAEANPWAAKIAAMKTRQLVDIRH